MESEITREWTIGSIFEKYPEKSQKLAQELTNAGLHCVGCNAAVWETLEAGMLGHGFSDEEIDDLVVRLNAILAEKVDLQSITVTEKAAHKFKQIAKAEGKEGAGLLFSDKPGGCGGFEYELDFVLGKVDGDYAAFQSNGVDIYVSRKALSRLIGSQIDYLDGLKGSGFKISNPNVKHSCSCGQSQGY